MQVHFVARDGGPERLVIEAEIHFEEGPLTGMRLVGFCLWKGPDGEVYVTFPSRAFGVGGERRSGTACSGSIPYRPGASPAHWFTRVKFISQPSWAGVRRLSSATRIRRVIRSHRRKTSLSPAVLWRPGASWASRSWTTSSWEKRAVS